MVLRPRSRKASICCRKLKGQCGPGAYPELSHVFLPSDYAP